MSWAKAHCLRSSSCLALQGQPNQAFSQPMPSATWVIGEDELSTVVPVMKMFQPPSDGFSFLARRDTTVPQSIPCTSRFRKPARSEEHTSELQSLMSISYAVFCLKKKKKKTSHATQAYAKT